MWQNTSAIVITYNEECIIKKCLDYIEEVPKVGQVVVVDNFSTDGTTDIVKNYAKNSGKKVVLVQKVWEGQDDQWNTGIDNSRFPWIFWLAADETFSKEINDILEYLDTVDNSLNGVRIPTLVTYPDDKHYLLGCTEENHTRIFRKGTGRFKGKSLEDLLDKNGRSLLWSSDPDILNCASMKNGGKLFKNSFRHHHQLLKTKEALQGKGIRWEEVGILADAAEKGMYLHKDVWANSLVDVLRKEVAQIPSEWL